MDVRLMLLFMYNFQSYWEYIRYSYSIPFDCVSDPERDEVQAY